MILSETQKTKALIIELFVDKTRERILLVIFSVNLVSYLNNREQNIEFSKSFKNAIAEIIISFTFI